jgi:hypothetical protein
MMPPALYWRDIPVMVITLSPVTVSCEGIELPFLVKAVIGLDGWNKPRRAAAALNCSALEAAVAARFGR